MESRVHDESPVPPRDRVSVDGFVVAAYESHHAEVFAFLARATRDPSVADGLLLETYSQLATEVREGRAPLEVRAWLYRVAAGLVIRSARRRPSRVRRLGRPDLAGGVQTIAPPEIGEQSHKRAAEMERVLEGLSTDARLALLLSGRGFAGEAIATAIGQSAAATRSLLTRARARVRVRRKLFADAAG